MIDSDAKTTLLPEASSDRGHGQFRVCGPALGPSPLGASQCLWSSRIGDEVSAVHDASPAAPPPAPPWRVYAPPK